MPVTVYVNRLFVDYNQMVRIFHNSILTVEKKPERNWDVVTKTIDDRVDPSYIFEDCLISVPANDRVPLDLAPCAQVNQANQGATEVVLHSSPHRYPNNNSQPLQEAQRVHDK